MVFYVTFYIFLAGLFAICMQGLFATLDERAPTWKLKRSLIGVSPGVGFRPYSNNLDEGTLIWYNKSNQTSFKKWTTLIDNFLERKYLIFNSI